MKKQLKVQITVTEEELQELQKVAKELGNKTSTIAKALLMHQVREFNDDPKSRNHPVKVNDLVENLYIYDLFFSNPPCKYIGRDQQGFFGFKDKDGEDAWIDDSNMELHKGELYFTTVHYYIKK